MNLPTPLHRPSGLRPLILPPLLGIALSSAVLAQAFGDWLGLLVILCVGLLCYPFMLLSGWMLCNLVGPRGGLRLWHSALFALAWIGIATAIRLWTTLGWSGGFSAVVFLPLPICSFGCAGIVASLVFWRQWLFSIDELPMPPRYWRIGLALATVLLVLSFPAARYEQYIGCMQEQGDGCQP